MSAAEVLAEIRERADAAVAEWDSDEPTPDPYPLARSVDDIPRLTDALLAVLAECDAVQKIYAEDHYGEDVRTDRWDAMNAMARDFRDLITAALTPAEAKL